MRHEENIKPQRPSRLWKAGGDSCPPGLRHEAAPHRALRGERRSDGIRWGMVPPAEATAGMEN